MGSKRTGPDHREVYFQDPELKQILPGQMKYSCVSATEPPGKPIKECQMVTVTLTMLHDEDTTGLPYKDKDASSGQMSLFRIILI